MENERRLHRDGATSARWGIVPAPCLGLRRSSRDRAPPEAAAGLGRGPSRPAVIPLGIGVIVFACAFGGALGGMFLRRIVPEYHMTQQTEDAVKLGMGMVATLSALVIGLLVASAKSSFDTKDAELRHFAANLILLDRQLVHYGPEAREAHDLLRRYTVFQLDSTWPNEASHPVDEPEGWMLLEDVQDALRALEPRDAAQRWL